MELLKWILHRIIYLGHCCYYYPSLACLRVHLSIKWSPWNPWAVARINMAWTKYVQTAMYEERLEVPREFHTNRKFENYAEQAYVTNVEAMFFISMFTRKEKLKVLFTPFSCGNRNRMPFYLISNWIFGGEE
jgi:hypothetical protein